MPTFEIYTERRYSTTVTVEAATYSEALAQFDDHAPGDFDDMDTAGEWEPLAITDDTGVQVWTAS